MGPQESVPGLEPGFFLVVNRPREYKNVEVVCEPFRNLLRECLIVVGRLPAGLWADRFTGLQDLTDPQLRWLYPSCAATVSVAHEDSAFLTRVDGNAFGRPGALPERPRLPGHPVGGPERLVRRRRHPPQPSSCFVRPWRRIHRERLTRTRLCYSFEASRRGSAGTSSRWRVPVESDV